MLAEDIGVRKELLKRGRVNHFHISNLFLLVVSARHRIVRTRTQLSTGLGDHRNPPERWKTAGRPSDTPERNRRTNTMCLIVAGEKGGGSGGPAWVIPITIGMAKRPDQVEPEGRSPERVTRPIRTSAFTAKTVTKVSRTTTSDMGCDRNDRRAEDPPSRTCRPSLLRWRRRTGTSRSPDALREAGVFARAGGLRR